MEYSGKATLPPFAVIHFPNNTTTILTKAKTLDLPDGTLVSINDEMHAVINPNHRVSLTDTQFFLDDGQPLELATGTTIMKLDYKSAAVRVQEPTIGYFDGVIRGGQVEHNLFVASDT